MQSHARKITPFIFVSTLTFFNLKIDFVDFLVKVLTLLTFSNKCESEKYHGAKLGYGNRLAYKIIINVKERLR
jgi:hypothetical protein